ncbi:hypothetical protein BU15DRAFT_62692 [Melanogaster broomeanus]|nr:hypothetical protein BU15DRAFT_62692 [Melanogaster broomeanus]
MGYSPGPTQYLWVIHTLAHSIPMGDPYFGPPTLSLGYIPRLTQNLWVTSFGHLTPMGLPSLGPTITYEIHLIQFNRPTQYSIISQWANSYHMEFNYISANPYPMDTSCSLAHLRLTRQRQLFVNLGCPYTTVQCTTWAHMEAHLNETHPEYAHPGKQNGLALPRSVYEAMVLTPLEEKKAGVPVRGSFTHIQDKENDPPTNARVQKRRADAEKFVSVASLAKRLFLDAIVLFHSFIGLLTWDCPRQSLNASRHVSVDLFHWQLFFSLDMDQPLNLCSPTQVSTVPYGSRIDLTTTAVTLATIVTYDYVITFPQEVRYLGLPGAILGRHDLPLPRRHGNAASGLRHVQRSRTILGILIVLYIPRVIISLVLNSMYASPSELQVTIQEAPLDNEWICIAHHTLAGLFIIMGNGSRSVLDNW